MWHTTCMQINQGDFRLLMVGSQINNLIPIPSFGHNMCFKYPNRSWKPILDIYVSRDFQWYKELFNLMNFDPCNRLLKIRKSISVTIVLWKSVRMKLTLPKWGFGSPPGLSKLQGSIARVKTLRIGVFFILLENY
jgi:hypothetical protein